jgi:hypothetical protein
MNEDEEYFVDLIEKNKHKELNNLNWNNSIKKLFFSHSFNGNISNIVWPDSIEYIFMGDNFNKNINNIIWPKSLKKLLFGFHFNQNINNINWPNNLEQLNFGFYFNQEIILNNENIILSFSDINPEMEKKLPVNLKKLNLKSLTFPLTNLPHGLESLKIKEDENNYLQKSKIPYGCKVEKI